jgi:hypothetical protein
MFGPSRRVPLHPGADPLQLSPTELLDKIIEPMTSSHLPLHVPRNPEVRTQESPQKELAKEEQKEGMKGQDNKEGDALKVEHQTSP